jgi:hypothetical protein
MYLGEINHGQMSYPGEHPAIVDKAIFDKVQEILAHNAAAKGYSQSRSQALLLGQLYDDHGHRMTPSFAMKRGVYRYYVSRAVTEGQSDLAGSIVRVPALDVEEAVADALHKLVSLPRADGAPAETARKKPAEGTPSHYCGIMSVLMLREPFVGSSPRLKPRVKTADVA